MKPLDDRRAAARLLELVGANWTTQAIGAAVNLGLIDALAEAPGEVAELARRIGCNSPAVQRLLSGLAAIGVCSRTDGSRYALTSMGGLLLDDVPGSVRGWAQWCSGPQWTLWGGLADCVRTGRSTRALAGRGPGYAHLDGDAEAAALFHRAMAGLTRRIGGEVARTVDWQGVREVVDVGGGYGELLAETLRAQPAVRGILFDLPHALQGAAALFERAGLAARCQAVAGSFFDVLPRGADVYLLKSILHNWDDADAQRILRQCRAAMHAEARLLVIERVLPGAGQGGRRNRAILRSDLNMLVSLGGRERTRGEFACLAREAGFTAPREVAAVLDYSVLQLRPARADRLASGTSRVRPTRGMRARSRGR